MTGDTHRLEAELTAHLKELSCITRLLLHTAKLSQTYEYTSHYKINDMCHVSLQIIKKYKNTRYPYKLDGQ